MFQPGQIGPRIHIGFILKIENEDWKIINIIELEKGKIIEIHLKHMKTGEVQKIYAQSCE